MDNFNVRLLKKSIGRRRKHQGIRNLYADRTWVEDLDIINELGGHTGCVNALSWSTGGGLLASGSDDRYLNIWDYNPANLAKPFSLNTSVSTGHVANIFSVKFMPHSNDRTVVTCAGDSQVRIFDLEYGGAQNGRQGPAESTRSRKFIDFFGNARWLDENNTNARVYRSHADRAKRIVTESSPHLFLTCSEDGEVRQWDLRQPSSAYPPPQEMRRMNRFQTAYNQDSSDHAPPPLISYKKYQLELNSISCSASQPHYIALGGLHLHCFLHDRRMLGRDISSEQGRPTSFTPIAGTVEDETMREATKCVRRFAPNNQRKMKLHGSGHITACKISDARPNELISSWSGDHIYSFDIVRSPDAREQEEREDRDATRARLRNQVERKRKRLKASQLTHSLDDASKRRLRRAGHYTVELERTVLRIRFVNGETEDIPIGPDSQDPRSELAPVLTEAQQRSKRVARSLVQLRRTLFDFSAAIDEEQAQRLETSSQLTPFTATFTKSMGQAAALLSEMDEMTQGWSYPVNPDEDEVQYHNTLRWNRQASWRFVQAAGTLSATLGGRLQTPSQAEDPRMANFSRIRPAPREGQNMIQQSRFCYDFLRAILLWLNGGISAVIEDFKRPYRLSDETERYPLSSDDTVETGPPKLRDYLLSIADGKPVIDLGTNRFERDELRAVFESQHAAVQSFIRALTGIELRVNHGVSGIESDQSRRTKMRVMDKGAAVRFWGLKVGRSLLMEAASDVTYAFVQHAFGGPRIRTISDEDNLGHLPHTVGSDEEDLAIESADIIDMEEEMTPSGDFPPHESRAEVSSLDPTRSAMHTAASVADVAGSNDESMIEDDEQDDMNELEDELEDDSGNEEEDEASIESGEDDNSDEDERPLFRSRVVFSRSRQRANANFDVPYTSHTSVYKGHCNTRTIKDVNYYGLDDEYVVSGSDDGHFFIWDRKTCQIVNILEGDGEVVNVVQGHPYEPMIACSGIDNTIKIFGPGGNNRDRHRASRGIDVAKPGDDLHSSLLLGQLRRATVHAETDPDVAEMMSVVNNGDGDNSDNDNDADEDSRNVDSFKRVLKSHRAMSRSYQITSQNDVMRRDGTNGDMTEALFATFLQQGRLAGLPTHGGGTIVLEDNCMVM